MKIYIRINSQFGPVLKSLREEKKLTQKDAAEIAGIDPKTVSSLEAGNLKCSIESYMKLLTAYQYVQIIEPIDD
jgi:transcriptional regulator with XRE-family HTH domain